MSDIRLKRLAEELRAAQEHLTRCRSVAADWLRTRTADGRTEDAAEAGTFLRAADRALDVLAEAEGKAPNEMASALTFALHVIQQAYESPDLVPPPDSDAEPKAKKPAKKGGKL